MASSEADATYSVLHPAQEHFGVSVVRRAPTGWQFWGGFSAEWHPASDAGRWRRNTVEVSWESTWAEPEEA